MGAADGDSPPPETPAATDLPTVRQQWILISVCSALIMVCSGLELWDYAEEAEQGKPTPYAFLEILINAVGCAVWLTMDRKRRGLEVGKWRIAALLFGPAAICIYLISEYKGRAVYLLPIVVAVYLAVGLLPYVAVLAIQRFWS